MIASSGLPLLPQSKPTLSLSFLTDMTAHDGNQMFFLGSNASPS
jgi:hypothetical protein